MKSEYKKVVKVNLTPHETACSLSKKYPELGSLSEADTRHQIIDSILHDVLSWPRAAVACEEYIAPGYADYVLTGSGESQLVFIEAKKEGVSFTLPQPFCEDGNSALIKIKTLMTDANINKAMIQVQDYCIKTGCEYACISNGHQWIFFKTFERHQDWRNLPAFVIRSLRFFCEDFTESVNILGYTALTEKASLAQKLGSALALKRERYYPKTKVPQYNHGVLQNYLASYLRPLADRYLGKMNPTDDEFMERCYVRIRDYQASITGVTQIIRDSLTPYFKNYNVREFFDDTRGGELGARIESHLRERRTREVVILFGGKGAGKSTFIRKLLYHRPPKEIYEHSAIAVVDLIECPEDKVRIEAEIAKQLLAELDKIKILSAERSVLLSLFSDRFDAAKKQMLAGLNKSSDAYNLQLNSLVRDWISDWEYCAARLADRWKTEKRGTIVILDNTDQYSPEVQDYCFTLAQHIASLIDGLVVISMREERFHESRLHGTLDAFQNNGFHLSSPPSQFVFVRRLAYMLSVLDDNNAARNISPNITDEKNADIKHLLRSLISEFRHKNSHLSQFLRACSHGNMRLSLDMFRQFLLSGYTKVEEILSVNGWTLQVHQVLRPMMIPDRFYYDEKLSSIPNVFQIRSDTVGSHFTALRILDIVSANMSPLNPIFIPVSRLKGIFASRYRMLDDLCKNLDKMLLAGILEANNRLDAYSEAVDSVKMTPYGYYMRDTLCGMFSYLDLVCVDCAIHEESVANSIAHMAREELDLFFRAVKGERIELRLQRVEEFLDYLIREAEAEREMLSLEPHEVRYASELKKRFIEERTRVRASANRYVKKGETAGEFYD